ncbi:MAG: CRISPR-associated endonuclease Cas3'' [Synergistaceae bacterium]|jgi:CRISPR-associated endonuclease/helicase Cas3|nr:CRISPR-associated endonuclease Cas3'' [Synergistaceae bacterium]
MTEYYARSPKIQTYSQHVEGVLGRARRFASGAGGYSLDGERLRSISETAAEYHDLGKLDPENQRVLAGEVSARKLPINHVDAGTAFLMDNKHASMFAAIAAASHHTGLPGIFHELDRGDAAFRDEGVKDKVDSALSWYAALHARLVGEHSEFENDYPDGDKSVFTRILLSCLVDADHSDAAGSPETEYIALRASERLARLDEYVAGLSGTRPDSDERGQLRAEMYSACRNIDVHESIASCASPVGTGKTTAVMAHLLAQAEKRRLRRIFVVLPFTNIIQQSVDVYRKTLVLPGENPEEVVAELHHRAEFESEDARQLTALWRAPIIVTTSVAFFETLAASKPSALRRLHELPGSAIFADEAHAALPTQLLSVAWRWMNILADEWSCYWVLASGSLNRFWDIEEISEAKRVVPQIVPEKLRASLDAFEGNRITYIHNLSAQGLDEFAEYVSKTPGPRLVILNTVQSAAVIARHFSNLFGRDRTEHLSTALTPSDRAVTLERVKKRLRAVSREEGDRDWTLVATSCVEAGVDLSFRSGFREFASLISLLQASGRINRNGEYGVAEMHSFRLVYDGVLIPNPGLKNAAAVLRDFIEKNERIVPSLTTRAIEKEIKLYGMDSLHRELLKNEDALNFPFVSENFNVIDSDTSSIAVVDADLAERVKHRRASWRELQRQSVRIANHRLKELKVPQITGEIDIYLWSLGYNDFIGYMAGVLDAKKFAAR